MRAASEIRFGDENRTQSLVHKRGDDGTRKKNDDPEKKTIFAKLGASFNSQISKCKRVEKRGEREKKTRILREET